MKGDVDNNGRLDVNDVVNLASHVQGNTPEGFNEEAADFNEDGKVDMKDVKDLANKVMGN